MKINARISMPLLQTKQS